MLFGAMTGGLFGALHAWFTVHLGLSQHVTGIGITISAFDAFYFGMTNGRGWTCVALVIFASWCPGKALIGALLFAGLDALQVRTQKIAGAVIPYQFFLALPYTLSIAAMMVMFRRAAYPKALLTPFRRGDRI